MSEADLDWIVPVEAALHPSPWRAGNFRDSLEAGHACWTFWEGSDPLAYAVVLHVLDEAHLLDITVEAAQQGRGVGGAVLGFLFDQARSNGARQFFLEVRESNQVAAGLYRSRGFEAIGRRKGYYPGGEAREDAIVMRCVL
ncbi:MAG: ribosomal protein S18-alanine N-acetyltransferase [Rhodocyclaceae bacterium]|nr:ribosomal protein S18-alanine N-acetyltransferase [Rhodocyclaceae bacterium]